MPKISVVMSVFNEPVEWMRQSIDSILNQTFTDFEFIIINDKPDRPENKQLLDEYASQDPRIVIITNEQNIGLTKSLNKGLAVAKGEYIARMDADDISMPERFEKQVGFMDDHRDVAAIGSYIYIIDENNCVTGERNRPTNTTELKSKLLFESPLFHPTAFFKRVIDEMPVFYDETVRYAQDYALWIKIFASADIANVPEKLVKYRISKNQISTKNKEAQETCSKNNKRRVVICLHLSMLPEDIDILNSIITQDTNSCDITEIDQFLIRFYKWNMSNTNIDIRIALRHLILIYANYLPSIFGIAKSLYRLLRISFMTNSLSVYSILSLVNKYRINTHTK